MANNLQVGYYSTDNGLPTSIKINDVTLLVMSKHKKPKANLLIGCNQECILPWNEKGLFVTLFGGYLVWFCLTVTCEHVS